MCGVSLCCGFLGGQSGGVRDASAVAQPAKSRCRDGGCSRCLGIFCSVEPFAPRGGGVLRWSAKFERTKRWDFNGR